MATHKPADLIPAAAVLISAMVISAAVRITEARYAHQAEMVKVSSDAAVQFLRSASDTAGSLTYAELRAELLRAGLDPALTRQAAEMLRQQTLDVNLPPGRRLNDQAGASPAAGRRARRPGRQAAEWPDRTRSLAIEAWLAARFGGAASQVGPRLLNRASLPGAAVPARCPDARSVSLRQPAQKIVTARRFSHWANSGLNPAGATQRG